MPTHGDEFGGDGGGGMGNLADELDMLEDEDYDEEEDVTEDALESAETGHDELVDGARDSGIDVSYSSNGRKPQARNFSKPFAQSGRSLDELDEDQKEENFTPELEDCLHSINRMAQYADATEDPLIPRAIGLLQDLGNQSTLESLTQRLNTSTNSLASHLSKETRALQTLSASLYSPFIYSMPLDLVALEEATPLIERLHTSLPFPDPSALTGLQKLTRETESTVHTLSQLTDTLQMGKQGTNAAARHLRTTQTIVEEMRRERENAETARGGLVTSGWHERIGERWCRRECEDVISGFEDTCTALRESLVQSVEAAAAA
jgi:hypothetical protein